MILPIFIIVVLIFSAIVHEYMHGWMANELGDPTAKNSGRLTLNPLAHLDWWGSVLMPILLYYTTGFIFGYAKPVPINPYNLRGKYDMVKVALAGPLSNFVLAIFFGLLIRFVPIANATLVQFLGVIVEVNLLLFVFNIIPLPQFDGSRVIFPFLPRSLQEFYLRAEAIGMIIALLFVLIAFPVIAIIVQFLFNLIVG
ncbi:MAG TPA: site-2 protease family protein [Candidatus Methylomirabilis sp.]|nr:site-2 protease family protein [Candidatus Methylomirabilis sp.]